MEHNFKSALEGLFLAAVELAPRPQDFRVEIRRDAFEEAQSKLERKINDHMARDKVYSYEI
jgi:hypothetical protein